MTWAWDGFLSLRVVALAGAALPGIGCFVCIAFTYAAQPEHLENFLIPGCANSTSIAVLPVSYAIGLWEPQRSFWLLVLFLHFPFRLFFAFLYSQVYVRHSIIRLYMVSMTLEPLGLVLVSIVSIKTHFLTHALAFAVWLISFCHNMLFNTLLHSWSEMQNISKRFERSLIVKWMLFWSGVVMALSTAISFYLAKVYCSEIAYYTFSLAEYVLVALNSLFYFLIFYEFHKEFVQMQVGSRREQALSLPSSAPKIPL